MRKVYLFGAALLIGSVSWGQRLEEAYQFGPLQAKEYDGPAVSNDNRPNQISSDRALNIVWEEDFNGQSGLSTTNGTWTQSGSEGSYWSISNATTSPNGFALSMDSEFLYWNSYDNVTETDFATTPVSGSIETPNIDLSTVTTVEVAVEFELNAMFCCNAEPWSMAVSTDGGSTWGTEIPIDLGLSANDNSNDISEPVLITQVISAELDGTPANNNDVRIRFTWDAPDANGAGQYSTHYYWAIDNIKVFELPANEMANDKMWLADTFNEYEYTLAPANQLSTLTVQNKITNFGLNAPSALDLEVALFDGSMTQVGSTVSGGTLLNGPINSGETDTITFATSIDLSTLTPGDYMVRSVIRHDGGSTADEVQTNDTLWRSFTIADNSMGHINYDASTVNNIAAYTVDVRFGNAYQIATGVDLHGLDVELNSSGGTSATTTTDIPVLIYVDDLTNGTPVGIYEFLLTSAELDAPHTFNFHMADNIYAGTAPLTLAAGTEYAVTVELLTGNFLWYNANLGDTDFSGVLQADGTWFWNGDEPHFTLNFDQSLSTGSDIDYNFNIGQNRPNPFDNNSIINYTLSSSENVSITFTDVTGKIVQTIDQGTQAAGSYQVEVNANDFAEGVYFYTFTIGDKQVTKRMVVNK